MKKKIIIIPIGSIILMGILVVLFFLQQQNYCDTLENRELRLGEIDNLGNGVIINEEIEINGYIISGYSTPNNRYGVAIFTPMGDEKYKFQSNISQEQGELLFKNILLGKTSYDIFWANKIDLDFAEITYTIDGIVGETINLDAKNNSIIYLEAPYKNYSVDYVVVDKDGERYK